jgi:NAD-dependent DNA ligase
MPPKKQKKDNADDAGAAPPPVFKDLVITVSGQFSRTQKEIKADIEAHGGKFATTVTKAVRLA